MNDETNTELETPVTETPEYPPEPADDDIVLRRLKDEKTGEEMDLRTPWIEREVMVPTTVRIPLYEEGVLLSTEELAKLNLAVVEYTQEQVDQMTYPAYYRNNPDLAPRVRQYKVIWTVSVFRTTQRPTTSRRRLRSAPRLPNRRSSRWSRASRPRSTTLF